MMPRDIIQHTQRRVVGLARVDDNRKPQFVGQHKLPCKQIALHFQCLRLIVAVEPDFADRRDPRLVLREKPR